MTRPKFPKPEREEVRAPVARPGSALGRMG